MSGSGEPVARPVWSRRSEAVLLVLRGRTARVAVPVAAVVGTVISVVNQAEVIIGGHATGVTWVRIAVNYVVPYIVASVAYLSACRSNHQR
ncbi:nitrate/nitrite transporter NrtS [Actinophytocola algeriensis]|uniref:Uncharacterized protein n=1 Tax=Actinophytocola algeriensis TaxID=1768010 RepID=A0A7W7Q8Q1_9PSEU|nr:nitrate/nitrite transporter NrtS [Actinophytocola algeriensis]MBB4908696.1 hypothetical protein [Actinophytocola algeriensis]MBE1474917.1 hypothetical protein [Actinophytocola algeriensis]